MSDVVIPTVYQTEIYLNEDGDVVIRQFNYPEPENTVVIPQFFLGLVIKKLWGMKNGD